MHGFNLFVTIIVFFAGATIVITQDFGEIVIDEAGHQNVILDNEAAYYDDDFAADDDFIDGDVTDDDFIMAMKLWMMTFLNKKMSIRRRILQLSYAKTATLNVLNGKSKVNV